MRRGNEIHACGTKVKKLSEDPFKSGLVYNTVESVTEHPRKIDAETDNGVPASTLFDDDSVDEAADVKLADKADADEAAQWFIDNKTNR